MAKRPRKKSSNKGRSTGMARSFGKLGLGKVLPNTKKIKRKK